jgi:enamine deaminase RidA (YjgF/YER057c/UK114 family)
MGIKRISSRPGAPARFTFAASALPFGAKIEIQAVVAPC